MLIVVILLAFIVVLLVGLASYTRIETSIAGNTQRQAQARENALLALHVALGQLQRYAGPDIRVTATAHNFGARDGTRHYTGVWRNDAAGGGAPTEPLTWLVSGNEFRQSNPADGAAEGSTIPAPLAVTPATPGPRTIDLVGRNSTGTASRTNYVAAPLTDLRTYGVPGVPANTESVVGRYAWWVGDQGVKAPVALPDTSSAVTYAPFDSAELRSRIRQQVAIGAGAADAGGNPVFEPRDNNNSPLVAGERVLALSQIAFLRNSSNAQLGLTRVQQNFHLWSPNNLAVLADTRNGGLRQDLSLAPALLGSAFAAWTNYPAYMEPFAADASIAGGEGGGQSTVTASEILPAYGTDPLRRRYRMTPHLLNVEVSGSHQVGPVLTYLLISFNVRTTGGSAAPQPLEVRARWMVSLWNPYTSALVPENLRLEVTGLPDSVTVINEGALRAGSIANFSLRDPAVYGSAEPGSPLRMTLPWDSVDLPSGSPEEDRRSWLPGRVYTWRSIEDTNKHVAPPADGYLAKFYTRSFTSTGETNQGVQRDVPGSPVVDGNDVCHLEVKGDEQLRVSLYVVRPDGDVRIGQFLSPNFLAEFSTAPQEIRSSGYQFSYLFRLAESVDTPANPGAWLTTTGVDVRQRTVPPEAFVVGENGNNPANYENYTTISRPDRLLDRASDGFSYNEDVPAFELPRAPLLSLGALQHFRLVGQRPFMIGNSWGADFPLNGIRTAELFDRFFFSGLVSGVTPTVAATGDLLLPHPLMKPLRTWDAAAQLHRKPTIDDLRATVPAPPTEGEPVVPGPTEARSSKFLVQGGAFNLNSTSATAWAAVLRSVRFPSPQSFRYLDLSETTGTGSDTSTRTLSSNDAQFFRFSQSAQETYNAEPGRADSSPHAAAVSPANTHLFRQGMRTLPAAQVAALAAKIVEFMNAKHAADGPFRSLGEFLSAHPLFTGVDSEGNAGAPRSLLEAAIADSDVNGNIAEFSSQWLTQGDLMTALAPVLFARSDTFVVRTYGEAVNPATNATEGRAWCEAIVQRVPEYLDRSQPEQTQPADLNPVNQTHGRRFKVMSFRWLTRADI
jgi:hypothetical protein